MVEPLNITKFPRTPHVWGSSITSRNDLKLTLAETLEILSNPVIIQEKADGSNVGLYFDLNGDLKVINRGDHITFPNRYFKKLDVWLRINSEAIFDLITDKHVLFSEWLYWRHEVPYRTLPSFFLVHDVYDRRANRFLSTARVTEMLEGTPFSHNPILHNQARFTLKELKQRVGQSQWGSSQMEGLYIRVDDSEFNKYRCKYVTPEFARAIKGHWRSRPLVPNGTVHPIERYWTEGSRPQE